MDKGIAQWIISAAAAAAKLLVVSKSERPHRRQPNRLPRPWDSPGKNTGVGCHFLLQCMKVTSESEVAQSCLTLSDPMDCGLSGSSVHGIFQARVLEWGVIAFSGIISRKGINRKTHIKTLQSWIMSKLPNDKLKAETEVENVRYISIQDNMSPL